MQSIDQEGKTVEEALEKALGILNRTKEDVDYEVLDEGSKGVLGVGARPILVRVRAKEMPEMANAKNLVSSFLTEMGISFNTLEVNLDKNDMVKIDLDTDDAGILIGKHGQTLEALQYLVNQVMHDTKFKFMVDISSYREKQNSKLIETVKKIASSVLQSKRRITLKPMTAFERRMVHETVKEYPDLVTKSIGMEPRRRVVISLLSAPEYDGYNDEQPNYNSSERSSGDGGYNRPNRSSNYNDGGGRPARSAGYNSPQGGAPDSGYRSNSPQGGAPASGYRGNSTQGGAPGYRANSGGGGRPNYNNSERQQTGYNNNERPNYNNSDRQPSSNERQPANNSGERPQRNPGYNSPQGGTNDSGYRGNNERPTRSANYNSGERPAGGGGGYNRPNNPNRSANYNSQQGGAPDSGYKNSGSRPNTGRYNNNPAQGGDSGYRPNPNRDDSRRAPYPEPGNSARPSYNENGPDPNNV